MSIWSAFGGIMEVELTAAEPESAMTAIALAGINISGVRHEKELVCTFSIQRRDYSRLEALCQKRGMRLRILRKNGLYYSLAGITGRKMLVIGIGILLCSAFFLPTRILFVSVSGNSSIPASQILSAAEEAGIRFGASRSRVRSEKVKNALLEALPQLQWAGVNTTGCRAVISVRERTAVSDRQETHEVTSIVADRDGFILSCLVHQGTAQVQPGQVVKKGQTLISGYTECGICIQATQAKGEILAQTRRELTAKAPVKCLKRAEAGSVTRRFSLLFGKKRIFFWKGSGISDAGCGRMYEQYDLTLPGGYRLPVSVCIDTYQHFRTQSSEAPLQEAELKTFAQRYLKSLMIGGSIQRAQQLTARRADVLLLQGSYVCTETIGKVKTEQIGETNGKTNGENR